MCSEQPAIFPHQRKYYSIFKIAYNCVELIISQTYICVRICFLTEFAAASTFRKPANKRSRKQNAPLTKSGASEVQQKDDTIQLFRALGKVLYGKRRLNLIYYLLKNHVLLNWFRL